MEVVSGGELYTALQAGVPGRQIHFQGNNKSIGELTMALENGVGDIVVDNLSELERLERSGSGTGRHRAHFLPHQAGYRRPHP